MKWVELEFLIQGGMLESWGFNLKVDFMVFQVTYWIHQIPPLK
jgi:hypothetical protein